jgi:DNA repair exonuclease SbcCD ATPase subunit
MGYRIKTVELDNVCSYGEKNKVEFPGRGVTIITALNDAQEGSSNGGGKTTLLSTAPAWCLFGDTIKGFDADGIIRRGARSCRVVVEFVDGERTLKVQRSRTASGGQSMKLWVDGADVSRRTMTQTQDELMRLLGIDFSIWRNSIVLGQNDARRFLDGTDKERKDYIGRLLEFDVLDTVLRAVREDRKEAERVLESMRGKLDAARDEVERCEAGTVVTNRETLEEMVERKTEELAKAEADRADVKKKLADLEQVPELLKALSKLTQERDDALEVHKENIERAEALARDAERTVEKGKKLPDLDELRDQIEAKGQEADGLEEAERGVKAQRDRMGEKKERLAVTEAKIEEYDAAIQLKDGTCPTCKQGITDEHRDGLKEKVASATKARDALVTDLDDLMEMVAELEKKVVEMGNAQVESVRLQGELQQATREYALVDQAKATYADEVASKERATKALGRDDVKYGEQIQEAQAKVDAARESGDFDELKERELIVAGAVGIKKAELDDAQAAVVKYDEAAARLVEAKERLEGVQVEAKTARDRLEQLNKLDQIFGQRGFRAWRMTRFLPYLERRVNHILRQITDRELMLRLEGGEKLNVVVMDGGQEDAWDNYSGGERKLLSVAFTLAVASAVSERVSGGSFDLLLLDELLAELDEAHQAQVVAYLYRMDSEDGTQVVISTNDSHAAQLLRSVPGSQEIRVGRVDGLSRVL